jgi:hypothetical protein
MKDRFQMSSAGLLRLPAVLLRLGWVIEELVPKGCGSGSGQVSADRVGLAAAG